MAITDSEFRAAMSRFASGVTVLTTVDTKGALHGLTVSAFSSLSASPPLVLACIYKETYSHFAFFERREFVVNILSEEQRTISEQFALPLEDKFAGIAWHETPRGLPAIDGCLVTLECSLVNSYDGGDHSILVGEIDLAASSDGTPLLYFRGDYRRLGDISHIAE